jgi:hypothetical protein
MHAVPPLVKCHHIQKVTGIADKYFIDLTMASCSHRSYNIKHLVCMGGFRNSRAVYAWNGETLELDETDFDHGTLYEIECETVCACSVMMTIQLVVAGVR